MLTLAEAAAYLRVPATDVMDLAATQNMPGRKIGDEWRFSKAALHNWLASAPGGVFPSSLQNPVLKWSGWAKDDPLYQEHLSDLARFRQENQDREQATD